MKKIRVASTSYVGLSIAVLLVQHHEVTDMSIIQEKLNFAFKQQYQAIIANCYDACLNDVQDSVYM